MADLEKTVSVLFKGDDQISGKLNTISGSLGSFGGKLDAATQPLANMALAVEKIDAAMLAMAVGGMVLAVSAAGKFESGLSEIHTLLRESPETISAFDQAIEEYAAGSTQSIDDILKAIYQALSANVSYGESIKFVSDAEKLAVAGKATLTESVDLLTSTLTAYGESWDKAGKYSDVFFKAVEIGKVTIPELSQSLSMVAPIAASSGVSIDQVSAAIAAMTAGGMKAGPAAEYLRGVISDLVKPSKESVSEFERLGISFGAAELASKGLSGKLQEVWEKSDGNVDVMSKLFGNVTSLQAALVLGADKSGYFAKALKELEASAGATELAYSKMVEKFEIVNQRLVNAMQLALVEAGKPLLDDWANIANGLGDVFKNVKVGLASGAFDEIYDAIDEFSTMFGDYLRDVAKNIPEAMKNVDFTVFLESIKELGTSLGGIFKALFGDIDIKTPEGLAAAMQKVVDSVTLLAKVSKGIADQLKPFAEKLGEWSDSALNADGKTAELAGKMMGLGQGVNAAISAINLLAPAMAIFSGALLVDAAATIGKLAIGLAALPAAPAIAATAGVAALGVGFYKLGSVVIAANKALENHDKMLKDTSTEGLAAKENLDKVNKALKDIPEVKSLMFETDLDTAIDQIETLNTCVTTFPDGFTVEAKTETEAAANKLNELRFQMNAFPPTTIMEFLADKKEIDALATTVEGIPALKKLTVDAELKNQKYIQTFMSEIGNDQNVGISIDITQDSRQKYTSDMKEILNPDGSKTWVNVGVDATSLQRTQDALKEIPTEKMLEIKLQGEIDTQLTSIKTNAETVQKAMEWTANVDIAGIESDTKIMEAAFASVSSEISDLSKLTGDLFSQNWSEMGLAQESALRQKIRETSKQAQEAHDANMALIEAKTKSEAAKAQKMNSKDALIKIDSTGLEPALEMIMWQILQKVQLKANEDHASFLLGIN